MYDCARRGEISLVFSASLQQFFWQSSAPRHSCEQWPKCKSPAWSALRTLRKRSECWEFMTHKSNTFSYAPSSKYQSPTLASSRQSSNVKLGFLLPEPHSNDWKAGLSQANTNKWQKRQQPWKYSQVHSSPWKETSLVHWCVSLLIFSGIFLFLKPLEYFQRQMLYTSWHWADLLKCCKMTGEELHPLYFLILLILCFFLLSSNLVYKKCRGNWSSVSSPGC